MITMQDIFNRINEEKRIKFNKESKTNTFLKKDYSNKIRKKVIARIAKGEN